MKNILPGDVITGEWWGVVSECTWTVIGRCCRYTLHARSLSVQCTGRHNVCKGAITNKIKHAIKLKTSPARLAQLLQPSLAFCFSLQPMTAHAVIGCKPKQNFIACFIYSWSLLTPAIYNTTSRSGAYFGGEQGRSDGVYIGIYTPKISPSKLFIG